MGVKRFGVLTGVAAAAAVVALVVPGAEPPAYAVVTNEARDCLLDPRVDPRRQPRRSAERARPPIPDRRAGAFPDC
ncbi:hypothetical protein [Actinosynnema mirum]|uniref:hypothetical protein n=1 Tax=Actinosynnema mirum TaxID=40567 RepID=UPI00019AC244|nr:hypothetical protein [Actinosynnema mirum]